MLLQRLSLDMGEATNRDQDVDCVEWDVLCFAPEVISSDSLNGVNGICHKLG